jgi:amino acid efflux transporter
MPGDTKVGTLHGTALYVGAILGTGMLVLPALAAQKAGASSLIAWVLMLIVSLPTAFVFSRLGAAFPGGGGVASFVRQAFGEKWSAVVGWWFFFALAPGVPAGALIGGQYAAAALHHGRPTEMVCALGILVAVFVCNYMGLKTAGWVQIVLVALLALILLAAMAVSVPHLRLHNLRPFAPGGVRGVLSAAGLLLYSFVGWEAVTHLSGEFRDPQRQLRTVTVLTLITIGVLYLGVVGACVLTLGPALSGSQAPLAALFEAGVGPAAGPVVAVAAILLTFGSINTYVAAAARLGAAIAREDGALPAWFGKYSRAGRVPRRSLGLLGTLNGLSFLLISSTGAGLARILAFPTACYIAVTVAGLVAGMRLLPRGVVTAAALSACVALVVVLMFTGWPLLLPLVLAGGALAYTATRERTAAGRTRTGPPTAADPDPAHPT